MVIGPWSLATTDQGLNASPRAIPGRDGAGAVRVVPATASVGIGRLRVLVGLLGLGLGLGLGLCVLGLVGVHLVLLGGGAARLDHRGLGTDVQLRPLGRQTTDR